MGFMDEYNKALAEEKKKKKKESAKKETSSFMQAYRSSLADMEQVEDTPVVTTTRSTKKDDEERTWFQKGVFEDGYQFGDVTKAILGTTTDVAENVGSGVMGMAEAVVDFATQLGAWGYGGLTPVTSTDGIAPTTVYTFSAEDREKAKKEAKEFIAKDLYDEEEIAKKIISNPVKSLTGVDADADSVLGEKSDSLVQSGGQLLATAGLQAVGVPWFLTTGMTSYGSELENAYKQDATFEEAGLSAAVSAGAEILTEKLSGGIKFGGKTLDDAVLKPFVRGISNKAVRTLVNLGLDATGEGLEEIASGYISAIGQQLSYMSEKELSEIFSKEDAAESFVGGFILGGVGSTVQNIKANKQGVDVVTGLNTNEQAVFDKVYKDRLAEAEENGKLSRREKNKLYDQVMNDLEKGYISTDDIESVLSGDSYNSWKQHSDMENQYKQKIEELENMPNAEITVKQSEQLKSLREALARHQEQYDTKNFKSILSEKTMGLVEGSRLAESYNERARRGQAFEADLSQYGEKQRAVIQSAIDSGILNNTNRTHEFVDILAKISADKGVLFDITNNEKLKGTRFARDNAFVNGYYDSANKTIGVNIDSAKAWQSTVGHEVTHVLEGTELYKELKNTLFEYAKSKGEYDSRKNELSKLYDPDDLDSELAADLVGDYLFRDADFINHLSVTNRNVFQKIYDEIKYLYKVVTAGSKEARELEKVKRAFDKAYKESANAQTDTKHSLSDSDGKQLTTEQQDFFKDSKVRDENGNLKVMYHGTSKGGFTVFDTYGSNYGLFGQGSYFTDNKEIAESYTNKGKGTNKQVYETYLNITNPIDMDVQGNYSEWSNAFSDADLPETGTNEEFYRAVEDFYRDQWMSKWEVAEAIQAGIESMGYDGITHIGGGRVNADGVKHRVYIAFNDNQIKNTSNLKPTDHYDIRYSLSDSDGKQLTKEQQEYFKDSKIRDADGNLKVMYHGSNADFTVFDKKKAKSSGYYGKGFYFTDSDSHAKQYGNTYDVYLNITNPLQDGTNDITKVQLRKFVEAVADDEDYGIENYGYGATVKSVVDSVYGKSDFAMLMDINASCVGNMVEAIELFNAVNGTSYNGIVTATETVAFYPEQIKRVDNLNPTADKDIRFSLSEPVEETKELMALHNLTEQKLLKSLALGGLPMPSVAIAKAQDGHNEFGDISLILPRETIDPATSRRNKLYSGDAWTPTYPRVEYKPNAKVLKNIESKIRNLVPYEVQDELGNLMFDADNVSNDLDRYNGNMVDAYKQNDAMKYAFLKDSGSDITLPTKEADLYRYGSVSNDAVRYFAGKLVNGLQTVEMYQNMGAQEMLKDDALKEAVADAQNFDVLRTLEPGSPEYLEYERNPVFKADEVYFRDIDGLLSASRKLFTQGVQRTVDRKTAKELIRNAVDQAEYENWLSDIFSGVVEKEGIRNEKDLFTPSGNRRSFEALHYEHNLENVVKAMLEKGDKGIGGFGGGNIFGASTTEFSSVDEMKQASDRLQTMPEEEYDAMRKEFTDRFFELAHRLPNDKNSFIASDDAANTLVEAVTKYKTRSGIANYLRRELKGWATYSEQAVDDLIELVNDIRKMPTGYFEAKPQRAVSFDEVGVFVIPNNADVKLKQELLNRGYAIAEYDPTIEGHRQQVVNQFEEYKFSLSNIGEQFNEYGRWNVHNRYATPATDLRIDIAPTIEESSVVAPVAEVSDMFPDNLPPAHQALENMKAQARQLYADLERAMQTGNLEEFERLGAEYDNLTKIIKDLENAGNEAIESITDADVPPEVDAPMPDDIFAREKANVSDPFMEREWDEVTGTKGRKAKAYMYEHPEVKPFFQEEAQNLLGELNDTTKGERWYNDELYYESNGEKGFMGIKRVASESIETLRDDYNMSYADIEKGLNAIIEDNGAENISAAKKIEFMLNDRLLNGYKNFYDNGRVEPNQGYINLLEEMQINSYSKEAFDALMANADQYAPVKPLEKATPDTMDAPIFESDSGQMTMIEPPKPNPKVANVLTESPVVEKQKSGIGGKLVSALVDKGMPIENLSLETGNHELQSKYNYALSSNTEARAQYFMEHGAKGVKSLKDLRTMVENTGKTDKFFDYLYHVHNIDRMTLKQRFGMEDKTVFGDTVTAEVSRGKVAQYEKTNPEFKAMAEEVYKNNRYMKQLLVDGGLISQKTADLWEKMYPHYVPTNRVDDAGKNISVPLDSRKTGVNNPIKRATGGNSDIMPLFESMAQRTEQTFRAIARNSFGIELKNTLRSATITKQNTSVDEIIDMIGAQDELLKAGTMNSNPTFAVFENGERVEFEITEDIFDALKPANKILSHRFENSNKKVVRGIGKTLNARRNLLTVWNPVFALFRNPYKDIQDVAVNSQHAVKTYANFPNAIYQMATNGDYAKEYHSNGGKSNTYFDGRTNKFKPDDNIFKKIIGIPVRAVETAGEFIEEIPRLAEYIASRQEGRSIERSMLDASRVTTNFAAGGDFTKFLNSHGFTFLNASVQGASQHVRNFREAKQQGLKGWLKVAAKYTIAGLPTILLNSMLWDDDEEYEELSDYVKQNYYVVAKTQDGKFVRIPKGRTSAVMGELFNQMGNLVTGDDVADFNTFYKLFMDNIAPSNPMDNNIIAPIRQVRKNEAWYGDELVPSRLQDLPDEEQYDESTDSISKWLGEKLNYSPYKINYLIDQYSGGAGDVFLPMLTPEAESGDDSFIGNLLAPWKKEITTDKTLNNKYPGDFYDLKDELEKKSNSMYATEEDTMRSMFMDAVSWDMSDLYKQKREIQNSDMSDSEKYEAVREIQEQINALAQSGMDGYNDVSIMGSYAEVGDRRFNYDSENGKWYEINETNSDGTTNYWYQMEQDVTKALGISYEEYWNNREEYNYAYEKPEQYALSQSVGGYDTYRSYTSALWDIKADKDENGKSISGSRKEKVIDYLNELDADYYTKIILFKNEYNADDTYNAEIVDYLNGRDDISYEQMETILKYLGFEVDSKGNIYW